MDRRIPWQWRFCSKFVCCSIFSISIPGRLAFSKDGGQDALGSRWVYFLSLVLLKPRSLTRIFNNVSIIIRVLLKLYFCCYRQRDPSKLTCVFQFTKPNLGTKVCHSRANFIVYTHMESVQVIYTLTYGKLLGKQQSLNHEYLPFPVLPRKFPQYTNGVLRGYFVKIKSEIRP